MGVFSTTKIIVGNPNMIPAIADQIVETFKLEGFTVQCDSLNDGAFDISLSKGGTFKSVLGMKSALKINMKPQGDNIYFEAGVGIFGQQAIPTVITMFAFWPVMIPQIWGMIQQSHLDDRALAIAERIVAESSNGFTQNFQSAIPQSRYCPQCGHKIQESDKFCPNCGTKM